MCWQVGRHLQAERREGTNKKHEVGSVELGPVWEDQQEPDGGS